MDVNVLSADAPTPRPNGPRKKDKVWAAAAGSGATATLGLVVYLIGVNLNPVKQEVAEIKVNQAANYSKLEASNIALRAEMKQEFQTLRMETERNFDRVIGSIKENKEAQYRIDSNQDERIKELAQRAFGLKTKTN